MFKEYTVYHFISWVTFGSPDLLARHTAAKMAEFKDMLLKNWKRLFNYLNNNNTRMFTELCSQIRFIHTEQTKYWMI